MDRQLADGGDPELPTLELAKLDSRDIDRNGGGRDIDHRSTTRTQLGCDLTCHAWIGINYRRPCRQHEYRRKRQFALNHRTRTNRRWPLEPILDLVRRRRRGMSRLRVASQPRRGAPTSASKSCLHSWPQHTPWQRVVSSYFSGARNSLTAFQYAGASANFSHKAREPWLPFVVGKKLFLFLVSMAS